MVTSGRVTEAFCAQSELGHSASKATFGCPDEALSRAAGCPKPEAGRTHACKIFER